MMKSKDTFLALLCIAVVAMGAILIYQYQLIQRVAQNVTEIGNKADQSNLAASVALQQVQELTEGTQQEQQLALEQWNDREPVGFKIQTKKNT